MDWRSVEREYSDEVIGETTLPVLFEESATQNADRPAQLFKGATADSSLFDTVIADAPTGEYGSLTYRQLQTIVHHLAAGFYDLGVRKGDRVGIFAHTRMEWAQCDFAILAVGGVVTTIYPDSTPRQLTYLLEDSGATGVVVENAALLEAVLETEAALDFIVVMDRFSGYSHRDDILSLADFHERGAQTYDPAAYQSWLDAGSLSDLASIVYTSGTTGTPKGVPLTHGNFRANINQVRRRFGPRPDKGDLPAISADSRSLSFLPLAHVFERLGGHFFMFASGVAVAYAESTETLREDFGLVRPTVATSVPRIYERFYDAVWSQAAESAVRLRIFEWASDVARRWATTADPDLSLRLSHALADRLVYRRVRAGLGGDVEILISGGGSLSTDLAELFFGMGLPIYEGYGLTETAPVLSTNLVENPQFGTLGLPVTDVEVRIDTAIDADGLVPESGGELGELLVTGPNVFDGYWNRPEESAQVFTDDGWFRTGDIVERRPDDYLVFRGRVKELLVLSTGKNVSPGPIEDAFATSSRVEQAMVLGDDEKFVSALIVPNMAVLREWATDEGIALPADPWEACADPRVVAWIQRDVERVNRSLEAYEQIKRFTLVPEAFTEANDLLTPTLKLKRRNIVTRHADSVAAMYAD
ncbi:long-chain fatty acid--CoA ligase [Haladaptatus sp. DYSN1]|uniref:AMP-dependent synthetase/ligase n=1 Tax=unclassified Haladaptatus TaxID=2622732 RepID=UPI00240611E0|nr:AMP-binding protein [Haladaptatus sp. DYSN1]